MVERFDCVAGEPRAGWLKALRTYLAVVAIGNLTWEAAHLPLYTLWTSGAASEITFAFFHCAGGDLLIALTSLALALIIAGDSNWPARRFMSVAAITLVLGIAYTGFSEWLNVVVRKSWAYSDLMPTIEIFGFAVGLSPMLQWVIIPLLGFWQCRPPPDER